MAYDRADWQSDFPDDVPEENGGTHVGMFLAFGRTGSRFAHARYSFAIP
jgi:hypothetical protein